MNPSHYELLELDAAADAAQLDAAYARLSAQYDSALFREAAPEIKALAAQKYAALATAYATLCAPAARAAYDAALGSAAALPAEDELDYRPLPPRAAARGAVAEISAAARPRRAWLSGWTVLGLTLALTIGGTTLLIWLGTRPTVPATGQMPLFAAVIAAEITDTQARDQLFALDATAAQGRSLVRQNPRDPQAWSFLGNAHFDFIQTIYEQAPNGQAYAQNLNRWLEASDAYSRSLALNPLQPIVRSDNALALIRYGRGLGNPSYVAQGLAEAERALDEDDQTPQVLLNVGRAFALADPPRTADAQRAWRRIVELAPDTTQARQAQTLLQGAAP